MRFRTILPAEHASLPRPVHTHMEEKVVTVVTVVTSLIGLIFSERQGRHKVVTGRHKVLTGGTAAEPRISLSAPKAS
jgi:hypothetical protein